MMTINDIDTNTRIRPATLGEYLAALAAGPEGAIRVEDHPTTVYVEGDPDGLQVEGGQPGTEDFDIGRIDEVDGDLALVAWASGVRTWTSIRDLREV